VRLVRRIWTQHLRPAPRESVADWADQFREIVKGPEKGRWRTSRTPYLREPMACMSEGSGVQRVVMQFATQLGKTEVLYNTVFQRIHRAPQDVLFVQPTLGDARDHSRERFQPTVRKMPEVLAQLPRPTSRDESNSWQTKSLAGVATLFFAGANSARSLASKPLGLALCDEIDGYPLDVDGEGDPLALVWERLSNFHDRKLLLCSTPTIKGASRIEAEYLASDQRRYLVPCPHCGHRQELVWGEGRAHGLQFLRTLTGEPRPDTAVHICEACGAAAVEATKTAMLADGQWAPRNPDAGGGTVAGFQLNKLYSPAGWKSWADIVAEWHKAKTAEAQGDQTKIKAWVNTTLAETYEERGDSVAHSVLQQRSEDWPLRRVLPQILVLVAAVDVQRGANARLEVSVWGYGRGEESQLVDRRIIYGDPEVEHGQPDSPWNELDEYLAQPIPHANGRQMMIRATAIDSSDGTVTQAVYRYARSRAHRHILAIKGRRELDRILGRPTMQDVDYRGTLVRRGVRLWKIGTDLAKGTIYARLRLTKPGAGYVHLSKHMPAEAFEQLTAERMVTQIVGGYPRTKWVKRAGAANEELDKAVYALAMAHYIGIPNWVPADWARAEAKLRGQDDTPDLFAALPAKGDDDGDDGADDDNDQAPEVCDPVQVEQSSKLAPLSSELPALSGKPADPIAVPPAVTIITSARAPARPVTSTASADYIAHLQRMRASRR
jgi:phage terminase large subunit GpA-like protein